MSYRSTSYDVLSALFLLLFCIYQIQSSAPIMMDFDIDLANLRSLPAAVTPYKTEVVRSFVSCSILCAKSARCKAAFVSGDSMPGSGGLSCGFLDQEIANDQLDPGTGMYIQPEPYVPTEDPPALPGGVYKKTVVHNDMHVAVFDFPGKQVETLGLAFNADTGKWPTLNTQCALSLQYVRGFTATVVSIIEEEPGVTYRLKAHCEEGETNWEDVVCTYGGTWDWKKVDVKVACVSSTCYRVNDNHAAMYNGQQNQTESGADCQPWAVTSQEGDALFILDDLSKRTASNYCRDPRAITYPYCRVNHISHACGVPECEKASWALE